MGLTLPSCALNIISTGRDFRRICRLLPREHEGLGCGVRLRLRGCVGEALRVPAGPRRELVSSLGRRGAWSSFAPWGWHQPGREPCRPERLAPHLPDTRSPSCMWGIARYSEMNQELVIHYMRQGCLNTFSSSWWGRGPFYGKLGRSKGTLMTFSKMVNI